MHLIIFNAPTDAIRRKSRGKKMASRRSSLRGTYVLYPPRVTRRSFVEGFRVHDEPTRHVRGSLRSRLSLPRRNIESRYLRFVVSRPRRSRVRNTRREHATWCHVLSRVTRPISSVFRAYANASGILALARTRVLFHRLSSDGDDSCAGWRLQR
jgi:hypothetical protein